jgi:molybdopterin-guanine dinucleotide biosynthesis protein A
MLAALDKSGVTGLILAGGEGRRMGGADKGLIPLAGRPLVAHVIDRLAPQVDGLLISANRNLDAYRIFGHPVLPDTLGERQGPLAGLQAGLAACPTPWLLTCPCDCPALPADLAARLLAAATAHNTPIAVARVAGKTQPAFQLLRRHLQPALEAHFAAGGRKLMDWCRAQGAVEVEFPDATAFCNLNSPDDLAALVPLAG